MFLLRQLCSDTGNSFDLSPIWGKQSYIDGIVDDKYIYIPSYAGEYDVYQLSDGLLKKNNLYNDLIIHDHYIDCVGGSLRATNIHTDDSYEIYNEIEHIIYTSQQIDKVSITARNGSDVYAIFLRYTNGSFNKSKYKLKDCPTASRPFESKNNIYYRYRSDTSDEYEIAYCNKLTGDVKYLPIVNNYRSLVVLNNKYYFRSYENFITVIDKNDQIRTFRFPYEIMDILCNDKYIIIGTVKIRPPCIYNMKLQLVRQINKYITHLSNKFIVFNHTEIHEIIPITYKIKKLFQNTDYKHILRMII